MELQCGVECSDATKRVRAVLLPEVKDESIDEAPSSNGNIEEYINDAIIKAQKKIKEMGSLVRSCV